MARGFGGGGFHGGGGGFHGEGGGFHGFGGGGFHGFGGGGFHGFGGGGFHGLGGGGLRGLGGLHVGGMHLGGFELLYCCPKKSGKTCFAALFVITIVLLFGPRHAEAYIAANDLEQAGARVYEMCRRIVEASPLLKRECKVNNDKITFLATGATITPLASDAASAAGGQPTVSCFDELWGFVSERVRRFWDELVPVPTRRISCRLTISYAGFSGDFALLEELYKRGVPATTSWPKPLRW